MTERLCCILATRTICGICSEKWCQPCFDEAYNRAQDWKGTTCPIPNTSGPSQGNHYTREWALSLLEDSTVRPLVPGEKVSDFNFS